MADDYDDDYEDLSLIEEDRQIVEKAHRCFKDARIHTANWRDDAREDFDFVAGEQWTEDELQTLRDQLRPVVSFNRIGPVIDVVTGTELQNRQEVRFIPREAGDVKVNEVLTGAAQWARDMCDAEDEESDAFVDTVICGMGWTCTRMDYEVDAEGRILIERVDPLTMFWDPAAKKRNLSDARWVMNVEELDRDEIKALWPDKYLDVTGGDGFWSDDLDGDEPHLTVAGDQYASSEMKDSGASRKKKIRVIEYQWWERGIYYRIADPISGEVETLDEETFHKLKAKFDKMGMALSGVRQTQRDYKQAFIAGDVVLDVGDCPDPDGFTYKAVTGKRDRNTNTWYGMVRAMKDPQRWANKWLSQTMHIINSNAKGGLMAEDSAFVNPRRAEQEWSDPTSITMLRDGALSTGKVQEKSALTYPAGLDRLMEFAVSSIRDVTGVSVEMLGMREGNQPGILEWQRKQAGVTILGPLFDSLRRYRKEQGRLLLHFILEYISDGRLIRIAGKAGEQFVPLVKDADATYDIVVDDAPTSPNQKEAVFATLSTMLPQLLQAGIPVPPEIIEYAPLPSALIEKWKALLSQPKGPSPEEIQMMQFQLSEAQSEVQRLRSADEAKMKKAMLDAQLKGVELENDRRHDEMTLAQRREMQSAELELKRQIAEVELQIQRMKAEADANMKIEQQRIDTQLKLRDTESAEPGRKTVRVVRDENGEIVGAEVDYVGLEPQPLNGDIDAPQT